MTLVYLDTETTGLDPSKHQIWEIAYAVDNDPVESIFVRHELTNADPAALNIGGYWARSEPRYALHDSYQFNRDTTVREFNLKELLAGATVVGSNPAFDTAMLTARWGNSPWHYRLLDVAVYAMPALALDKPQGLAHIAEQLGVQAPDHTAAGDVHTLRECHRKLQAIYRDQFGDRGWEGE